jgi:hypothetical protein
MLRFAVRGRPTMLAPQGAGRMAETEGSFDELFQSGGTNVKVVLW